MTTVKLHIENIGDVDFVPNQRAKNLRIRIHPDLGIRVTVPGHLSIESAIAYLRSKREWIKKAQQKLEKKKKLIPVFSENSEFVTRYHELKIGKHAKNTLRARIASGKINIWYPQYAQVKDQRIQGYIRKIIVEALRIEAKKYLPQRISDLAKKYNLNINDIRIRHNRTRWGSCSSKNNINLNLHLMRLPDRLIDYVLLHELTHTVVRNHSKKFWDTLEEFLPGSRDLDKELNQYSLHGW